MFDKILLYDEYTKEYKELEYYGECETIDRLKDRSLRIVKGEIRDNNLIIHKSFIVPDEIHADFYKLQMEIRAAKDKQKKLLKEVDQKC